ncbi:Histidine kinase-like ATPase domain-containing protein [Andreprevotia lacus DSM 23236]|uniref:Histidine kinase-like ATPase domain-containing protein n=1 Tax=Andreprevotia lacus DSM 23236 TaxID=1121001 RepID=A0A1W1Y0L2_9NEIS|nr:response regulator [Andreprevotia lacus]SMC29760.1 Histidine kinase-like ATPase domain-containing protein [Andreprevotia lacus DSM 23236]
MPTQSERARVLIVDDEPFNLEILSEHLLDEDYEVVTADDGEAAWNVLANDKAFDAILLDRMMPRMDGMALLARLKQRPEFEHVPIIMQTAVGAAENVREGLAAGAYYYLIKPFQRDMLLAIVAAAVSFHREKKQLEAQVSNQASSYRLLQSGEFQFQTLDEARQLTLLLSNACPDPQKVALGLSELLVNAVEHGNLGISYGEKTRLLQLGRWHDEVSDRLGHPSYASRRVCVRFRRDDNHLVFEITDEGNGFDWKPFLEFSPDRAFDPHGRGISMARMLSFDHVEYQGKGNQVVARVKAK